MQKCAATCSWRRGRAAAQPAAATLCIHAEALIEKLCAGVQRNVSNMSIGRARLMKVRSVDEPTGASCWPDHASQGMESTPVANSDENLLSVLAKLEECRAALLVGGSRDTAELVSVVILELRMKLNEIDDAELKALCEEMMRAREPTEKVRDLKSAHTHRRRPLLRLVK
jgi:hypothetical protein